MSVRRSAAPGLAGPGSLRQRGWQRRPSRVRRALLLGLLCLGPAAGVQAQFVAPEGSDFRNGSTFRDRDEGAAGRLLVRLDEALLLGDDAEVLDLLASLRRRQSPDLLAFGPRTVVPALDLATRRVLARGDEALAAALLAQERAAIEAARQARDLDELLDRATRTPALASSDEATWIAAQLLFEQGRWWQAASLAGRLPATAAVDALRAAALAELPDETPRPARGPWQGTQTLTLPLDTYGRNEALPLIVDGRPGETLVLDHDSLQGFDLAASQFVLQRTFPDVDLLGAYLRTHGFDVGLPAPRRYALVRRGDRVVFPFNVAADSWRGPEGRREARLLAFDLDTASLAWDARLPEPETAAGAPTPADPADVPGAFGEGAEVSDFEAALEALLSADAQAARAPPRRSSAFGPPVLAGPQVVVPVYRIGLQTEVSLAVFALDDGRLLHEVPLVLGTDVRRFASRRAQVDIDDVDKRAREGLLAVEHGIAHVCTGFGAVLAVDLLTGRVLHGFRYDRRFAQERAVHHPAFLFDTGGWNHEPVRLWGERVVVAPSDSRFLYMLARQPGPEGQLILEDPIERLDRRDIATLLPDPGGSEAPAVLATRVRDRRASLVLLGPNGHTLATSPALAEGETLTGRPLSVGGLVIVPTSFGLRLAAAQALEGEPALVPPLEWLQPPAEVTALRSGLMILHPGGRGSVNAVHWMATP